MNSNDAISLAREVLRRLRELLGKETELDVFQDMPAVWTEPESEWMQRVFAICAETLGEKPEPGTVSHNSDAGNFLKAWRGAPTVILGPGEHALAPTRPTSIAACRSSGSRWRSTRRSVATAAAYSCRSWGVKGRKSQAAAL